MLKTTNNPSGNGTELKIAGGTSSSAKRIKVNRSGEGPIDPAIETEGLD